MATVEMNSGQATFIVEFPDGRTITGNCESATIEREFVGGSGLRVDQLGYELLDSFNDFAVEITLSNIRNGVIAWQDDVDNQEQGETRTEWRCPYCQALMAMETRRCKGCGAWRPITYDDQARIRKGAHTRAGSVEV